MMRKYDPPRVLASYETEQLQRDAATCDYELSDAELERPAEPTGRDGH